jgi:hypothetical protein
MRPRQKATLDQDPETGRVFIHSVAEIPVFASDEEEVEFWNTHELLPEGVAQGCKSPEEVFRDKGLKQLPKR